MPWRVGPTCRGNIFEGSWTTPLQSPTWERVHEDLRSHFANFWLHLVKRVHVTLPEMSEAESGAEPQPAGSSSPLGSPKVGKNLGQVFMGSALQPRSQKRQEQNTVLLELHLQKQLLWLTNELVVLKITFYKNRRVSSNLSHSATSTIPVCVTGNYVSIHPGQI